MPERSEMDVRPLGNGRRRQDFPIRAVQLGARSERAMPEALLGRVRH